VKVEAWVFGSLTIFMVIVTPTYWLITYDPQTGAPEITGVVALILTTFLVLMIWAYLLLVARRMQPRPEDRKDGEIAEGAGELGFYPPQSKWPLFLSLTFVPVVLAPVYGWWLMLIGFGFGFITLTGLLYEFYRGDHAH
jgi:MFS superfamily sulfate permease-like transporter